MKTYFNFRFDNDLKKRAKDYGDKQEPQESISLVIHKALYKYLRDEFCVGCGSVLIDTQNGKVCNYCVDPGY